MVGSERLTGKQVAFTQKTVFRFGFCYLICSPMFAFWTGSANVEVLAIFIAVNGLRTNRQTLLKFPWTSILCFAYPIGFIASVVSTDPLQLSNWLVARDSPVLAMRLAFAIWGSYAGWCLLKSHRIRRRERDAMIDDEFEVIEDFKIG